MLVKHVKVPAIRYFQFTNVFLLLVVGQTANRTGQEEDLGSQPNHMYLWRH